MTKFQNTHTAIIENAMKLFRQHGYSSTSVGSIAKTTGITEMTFYRHFPNKEAILLDDPFDPIIADYILRQPPEKRALSAVVAGFRTAWREAEASVEDSLKTRLGIIAATPELKRASLDSTGETVEAIKTALVARGSSEIEATTVASAILSALSSALLLWAASDTLEINAVINDTLDALEVSNE